MNSTLERPAATSVVRRSFEVEREVKTMTASVVLDRQLARRTRPTGLDRIVMRISLAMLLWARRHADRTAISREEHIRRYEVHRAVERRERDAAQLVRTF